tara:strand:- start:72 stop:260 length:189 start_codon:yes stop_codon:yes gene_type:complete
MNLTDKIIDFECGLLDDTGVLELFAELIKNGMAWTLQGSYGRTASDLIDAGYIDTDGNITMI